MMGLDVAAYKDSYICYVRDDDREAVDRLMLPECKSITYTEPDMPFTPIPFPFFVDTITRGRQLALVVGSAPRNRIAKQVEGYKQQIELTGIVAFQSTIDTLIVENRHGTFTINSYQDQGKDFFACALFRIHDFQRDLIYISGTDLNSLNVGIEAYSSIYAGPLFGDLISDDALLVLGSVTQDRTMISNGCYHLGSRTVSDLSIQKLRLLDHSIGV